MGDTEWDGAEVKREREEASSAPPKIADVNPTVANFVAVAKRKTGPGWTLGTKSLLVVVMDWMAGDSSRAPMSSQTLSPRHYETRVFPHVRKAFQDMSNGRFDLQITFVPEVVRYTRPRARYTAQGYPFPGLYNGAKNSLEGNGRYGRQYNFDDYDLVYVINPQQAPTGTKGVAWVGAKGAICNGCEAITENFQVMVAVHELGHNLGLWHASSKSLEYGNVFDWMGNYPDVGGLSYGLGYKMKLGWVPQSVLHTVVNRDLAGLNDRFYLSPFDVSRTPQASDVLGIKVSLSQGTRDLYISYRFAVGEEARGVFLTLQDKDKANSELVDCACHTPSQRDARLRPGWTYVDPSKSVVVYVESQSRDAATVHIFEAPGQRDMAAIRGRQDFTDGQWKCPRTCTDSDLLVSQYNGCPGLARDGYCRGGKITMSGKKYFVKRDLCPKSCNACDEIMSGGTLDGDGCDDRNIKISGKSCRESAAAGYCDYNTNLGNIGTDLCPRSCGKCPPRPDARSSTSFENPTPVRFWGSSALSVDQRPAQEDDTAEQAKKDEQEEKEEEEQADKNDEEDVDNSEPEMDTDDNPVDEAGSACTDDPVWTDPDGDGCDVYATYIRTKSLTLREACDYGEGHAKAHCRKTCRTCDEVHSTQTCKDKACISKWHKESGQCFACKDWPTSCNETFFKNDCPMTCGVCVPRDTTTPKPTPLITTTSTTTTPVPTEAPTPIPPVCEDSDCVESWQEQFGNCWNCKDLANEYCGNDPGFRASCPRSCKLCEPDEEPACANDFLEHTCKRYKKWGWCTEAHIVDHCKATCGVCAAQLELEESVIGSEDQTKKAAAAPRSLIALFTIMLFALVQV